MPNDDKSTPGENTGPARNNPDKNPVLESVQKLKRSLLILPSKNFKDSFAEKFYNHPAMKYLASGQRPLQNN